MLINSGIFSEGGNVNFKKFTKTVSASQTSKYTFNIGDSDIAQHYNDASAICIVIPTTSMTAPALLGGINSNRALGTDSSGTLYGSMNMVNNAGDVTTLPRYNSPLNGNASVVAKTRGVIEADANGNVKIVGSGTAPLKAGDYEIYFIW